MPAPWYTEQAAIVYRKQKNFVAEVRILQRWIDAARRNGCAVQSRLCVVAINLSGHDDDQLIFETLNDRGAPLLKADLIKKLDLPAAREDSRRD